MGANNGSVRLQPDRSAPAPLKKQSTARGCPLRDHLVRSLPAPPHLLRARRAEKRRASPRRIYWGRPVPGFGDPRARLLLVGLAPAAHGANRTGRVFTGDGVGGSGDFLMSALHRAGFSNLATSHHLDDGLQLNDAFIAAAVRCAPPDNKPTPEEITRCLPHLDAEIAALPRVRVVVALGKIAFDAYLQLLKLRGEGVRPRPEFGHAVAHTLPNGQTLIGCYHPSRQNTNTGKLTAPMIDDVFKQAASVLRSGPGAKGDGLKAVPYV